MATSQVLVGRCARHAGCSRALLWRIPHTRLPLRTCNGDVLRDHRFRDCSTSLVTVSRRSLQSCCESPPRMESNGRRSYSLISKVMRVPRGTRSEKPTRRSGRARERRFRLVRADTSKSPSIPTAFCIRASRRRTIASLLPPSRIARSQPASVNSNTGSSR